VSEALVQSLIQAGPVGVFAVLVWFELRAFRKASEELNREQTKILTLLEERSRYARPITEP